MRPPSAALPFSATLSFQVCSRLFLSLLSSFIPLLTAAGDDHVARIWGSDVVVRHGDFVRGLAVLGGELVTASWDKTLRLTKL